MEPTADEIRKAILVAEDGIYTSEPMTREQQDAVRVVLSAAATAAADRERADANERDAKRYRTLRRRWVTIIRRGVHAVPTNALTELTLDERIDALSAAAPDAGQTGRETGQKE